MGQGMDAPSSAEREVRNKGERDGCEADTGTGRLEGRTLGWHETSATPQENHLTFPADRVARTTVLASSDVTGAECAGRKGPKDEPQAGSRQPPINRGDESDGHPPSAFARMRDLGLMSFSKTGTYGSHREPPETLG